MILLLYNNCCFKNIFYIPLQIYNFIFFFFFKNSSGKMMKKLEMTNVFFFLISLIYVYLYIRNFKII